MKLKRCVKMRQQFFLQYVEDVVNYLRTIEVMLMVFVVANCHKQRFFGHILSCRFLTGIDLPKILRFPIYIDVGKYYRSHTREK